jgi:hypothetical protein
LLTPRDDLGGEAPRYFLHFGREWVERELENRERQWADEGRAPRALDRDTFAYRYGPLGRHEVVMYFDLCRVVIHRAWQLIVETPEIDPTALTQALHEAAQRWLAEGSIDDDPTPPAVIIENERRRVPLVGDGSHLDCDCPLCRMEADGALGPMFRNFDGYHLEMDDEFAFSLRETREEWEGAQEDFRRQWQASEAGQGREQPVDAEDAQTSVWTRSYVNDELLREENASSPWPMFALAMRVGELITDLKEASARRQLLDALNNAFDTLRQADDQLFAASVSVQLVDALEEIAAAYPHLTPKAADLQSQLDELQRRKRLDTQL